ncbi:MAG: SpoIIE family protein phosphatase [Capsulimonadaceae bacterium]|nr:SpoIIE family protein phosphatase [Capsulimonadaceae bacterium]
MVEISYELALTIVESIQDPTIIVSHSGQTVAMNGRAKELHGVSTSDEARDLFYSPSSPLRMADKNGVEIERSSWPYVHAASGSLFHPVELHAQRIDSGKSWQARYLAFNLPHEEGNATGCVIHVMEPAESYNLSEQLQQATALEASERTLRLFVEHAPAEIAMFDKFMRYIAVSERCATDFHLNAKDLIGRSHYDVFPEIPERWKQVHQRCLAGATEKCDQDPFPRADGTLDWLRWEVVPWRDSSNEIGGLIIFSEIVTERKRIEEALQENESLFRLLMDMSLEGVILVGATNLVRYANARAAAILGYDSSSELIGRSIFDFLADEARDRAVKQRAQPVQTSVTHEYEAPMLRKDKSEVWVLARVTFSWDANGTFMGSSSMITDLSAQRETNRALKTSEARYRTLTDTTSSVVWRATASGKIVAPNQRWTEFTGQELPSETIDLAYVLKAIHPDDVADVDTTTRAAFATGNLLRNEFRLWHAPSQQYRYVRIAGVPVRDDDGEIAEWIGTLSDIDSYKRSQLADALMSSIAEKARDIRDPKEVVDATINAILMHIGADGIELAEINQDLEVVRFSSSAAKAGHKKSLSLSNMPIGIRGDLAAGKTVVVNDRYADSRITPEEASRPQSQFRRAFISVPRIVEGKWLARLSINSSTPRIWRGDEIALAERVAYSTWLAIDNARLFTNMSKEIAERRLVQKELAAALARERKMVDTLQRSLMQIPQEHAFAGISFETHYEAAGSDLEIGGDFLDAFAVDSSRVALVVGDVSGKGLDAASHTAEMKFLFRGYLRQDLSAARSLRRINEYLCQSRDLDASLPVSFICMAVAVIDTRSGAVQVTNAGGEPPILLERSGRSRGIAVNGMPLGILPEFEYQSNIIDLSHGDRLIMFTDGITEARHPSGMFGREGVLKAVANASRRMPLKQLTQRIVQAAKDFAGHHLQDDACLLVARWD